MSKAYAYSEENNIVIGNESVERKFITENDKLRTVEIINKCIGEGLSLKLSSFSAEFFIGLKTKGLFRDKIEFLSSNELTLKNVNIFKNRIEFIFNPYAISGARINFILNYEVGEDSPYMTKYIELIVDEQYQSNVVIDCIDLEHLCFTECEKPWCIGEVEKAYLSPYHSSLGQPFYINGMFFASTFPLADTNIKDGTAFIRYYSGKRFNELNLQCGTTYTTWKTVLGASNSTDYVSVKREFLEYVRSISRKVMPRIQYNSWYDHMLDITDENITKSFMEIEDGLSKSLVEPIDSYVVDDGFVDYKNDFWSFNSKFPNGFDYISKLPKKFSSNFGMWIGPRGGYNDETGPFGKRMEKSGKGGYNKKSNDVCVADKKYIKNITEYFIDSMSRYDINYWKLDGFLLKACPSKNHGHITGGFNDMYEYTEMWENWTDIFRKMRIHRETNGKDLWINQTSYCNASPFFLQWADSLWMQNSADVGMVTKTDKGEKLSTNDVDKLLTYRDGRYYDFFIKRKYQFPPEYLYNHDPIYGNTAKVSMTDDEYRKYLFMMATRGNYFWELYYSYNMLNASKWAINADLIRFVKNNADVLKNSVFIGSDPVSGKVYGYSAWNGTRGIVSLRNPSTQPQEFTFVFDKIMGCNEFDGKVYRANIYPYSQDVETETYCYGESITVTLEPNEVCVMKFTAFEEKTPNLIYSRFDSENELLIFFDDRVYLSDEDIVCDNEILSAELLSDYSTVKVTFTKYTEKASLSLKVKNAFSNETTVNVKATNYQSFICNENIIPNGRDFTISFNLSEIFNGSLLNTNGLSLSLFDGGLLLKLLNEKSTFETSVSVGDVLTLVCEPNSLVKLYKNKELLGSVYCKTYVNSLLGQEIEFSKNIENVKMLSKAIKYTEVEGK